MKVIYIVLLGWMIAANGQQTKDLDIDFMLRGHIYAGSSIVDTTALGGYGSSDNVSKKIRKKNNFKKEELYLFLDTTKTRTIWDEYNGYTLYLINNSDSLTTFLASDSRLEVVAEVWYKESWQPIEYLPSSWCGNSYHDVFLQPGYYWAFVVPKFAGKIKTKLRYKLDYSESLSLYSNEIDTYINKGQLTNKKEYFPNGLMDPYKE